MIVAVFALFAVVFTAGLMVPPAHPPSKEFEILTLSTRPEMVSGGDVLVQISVSHGVRVSDDGVTRNGRKIAGDLRSGHEPGSPLGLVKGLVPGINTLVAKANGKVQGKHRSRLELGNYPITGPIFPGPHEQPFIVGDIFLQEIPVSLVKSLFRR